MTIDNVLQKEKLIESLEGSTKHIVGLPKIMKGYLIDQKFFLQIFVVFEDRLDVVGTAGNDVANGDKNRLFAVPSSEIGKN